MKHYILLITSLVFLAGCKAVDTIKTDYMKSDQWNEHTMPDAIETIKKDYLGAEETSEDRKRADEIKLIAKQQIVASNYAAQYQISAASIDHDPGMPDAFSYYFVHFPLLDESNNPEHKTYLVVINRYNNQVEYSGVFIPPAGDAFYRYNEILKNIKGK